MLEGMNMEHKLEMDNTLEDFKKEVLDNKSTFKQTAPFTVAKSAELENSVAIQAIN